MDDVLLNKAAGIQRAVRRVREEHAGDDRLGVPQETREAFSLLETAGMLDHALADQLRKMVGFRNVAIHEYQKLDLDIVRRIVAESLEDFLAFTRILLKA